MLAGYNWIAQDTLNSANAGKMHLMRLLSKSSAEGAGLTWAFLAPRESLMRSSFPSRIIETDNRQC